jgi:hypothetical protein
MTSITTPCRWRRDTHRVNQESFRNHNKKKKMNRAHFLILVSYFIARAADLNAATFVDLGDLSVTAVSADGRFTSWEKHQTTRRAPHSGSREQFAYTEQHGRRNSELIANRAGRSSRCRSTPAARVQRTAQAGGFDDGSRKAGPDAIGDVFGARGLSAIGRSRETAGVVKSWPLFRCGAEAMRRILVEAARRKAGPQAGGGLQRLEISCVDPETQRAEVDLLALHEAVDRLAAIDARKAELVKLRFFASLTNEEAAGVLGITARTAYADWNYAKAWLRVEMS